MEEKNTKREESNTYFEERIAHIHNIRKSGQNEKNKIESLVSIAADFHPGEEREFSHKCIVSGIYDTKLLCDTMIDMAEDRMIAHDDLIMDEFHDFVEHFREITQAQDIPAKGKDDFNRRCMAIQDLVKELMSKYSEMEEDSQQKDYYRGCLVRALGKIEQLDNEKRKLEWELADKPKEIEEQVLMNLIEIAKNKPIQTRQGIKSLLQDYVNKSPIPKGPLGFHEELASLDDEHPQPKVVTVNGGVYNEIHDNKNVKLK